VVVVIVSLPIVLAKGVLSLCRTPRTSWPYPRAGSSCTRPRTRPSWRAGVTGRRRGTARGTVPAAPSGGIRRRTGRGDIAVPAAGDTRDRYAHCV